MGVEQTSQSASRNALTDEDYARLDRIIANRIGLSSPSAWAGLIPLAESLKAQGHRLIPPMTRGGHTKIVFATGEELSLSAYAELLRVTGLVAARCEACGGEILQTAERGTQRGPRVDRRYCSNACRQRAYRERRDRSASV